MTELTQAELAKELGFWPATAKGWTWTWQRCSRYDYRKRLAHSTNPDHLDPSAPSPAGVPSLQVTARYAAGRPRPTASRTIDLSLPLTESTQGRRADGRPTSSYKACQFWMRPIRLWTERAWFTVSAASRSSLAENTSHLEVRRSW